MEATLTRMAKQLVLRDFHVPDRELRYPWPSRGLRLALCRLYQACNRLYWGGRLPPPIWPGRVDARQLTLFPMARDPRAVHVRPEWPFASALNLNPA
jgi:hypothetical protein